MTKSGKGMQLLSGHFDKESEGEVLTKDIRQEEYAHAQIHEDRANVNADSDVNTIAHEVANSNANSFFLENFSYIMTDSSCNARRWNFYDF